MMSCTGFCLTSVLVQSVCDAWWGGDQREGMALWYVGVDFLCGTVGLQLDIFSTHMFCFFIVFSLFLFFLYLCHVNFNLNHRSRIANSERKLTNQSDYRPLTTPHHSSS